MVTSILYVFGIAASMMSAVVGCVGGSQYALGGTTRRARMIGIGAMVWGLGSMTAMIALASRLG